MESKVSDQQLADWGFKLACIIALVAGVVAVEYYGSKYCPLGTSWVTWVLASCLLLVTGQHLTMAAWLTIDQHSANERRIMRRIVVGFAILTLASWPISVLF